MTIGLLIATFAAAMIYVLTPGPMFLALFAVSAQQGRSAGAWLAAGHLVGDVLWGALALAAIIGVNQLGAIVFETMGAICGAYLIYLGIRAILSREATGTSVVGQRHPVVAGLIFGLTNPKAYPVSLAMFTVLVGQYAGLLTWESAPAVMITALAGFIVADVILVAIAGLAIVRRFFLTNGLTITRLVGVTFVLFGVKSLADAVQSFRLRA
ncbi:MAG: LysE family translocator [Alphaproteobacteria bacterium]